MRNHTAVTVFILLGLTDDPQLQILLFNFLFITYILIITGNLTFITLTLVDPHLKTPIHLQTLALYDDHEQQTVQNNGHCCCWMAALMTILPSLSLDFHLEFCDSSIIDHFDVSPLLKISCSDTWLIEQTVIACSVLIFIITLLYVVISYIYIIRTILKFPSLQQRKKVFSTCSSQMIVLSISYGSCIFIYIKPFAKE
ncbi:hypothetical protein Celaphus_00011750, partial [Cervus elaphus hippelaphus]